jgi:hypothetical protein
VGLVHFPVQDENRWEVFQSKILRLMCGDQREEEDGENYII